MDPANGPAHDLSDDKTLEPQGPLPRIARFWRLCRRHPGASVFLTLLLASLSAAFGILVSGNRRLEQQLQQNEAMNRRLQMTLTKEAADRIDSDLRQLAQIPQVMAATLAVNPDWSEDQLKSWLMQVLDRDSRIYGTCIAFEPWEFDGMRQDYAPYVYRKNKPFWDPLEAEYKYRERPWYKDAKEAWQEHVESQHGKNLRETGEWTEPFFDEGGENKAMVTYTVPILRTSNYLGLIPRERFAGVATVDLSLEYFDDMRKWIKELSQGNNGYGFVISSSGVFICHPDPKFKMSRTSKKISEMAEFQERPALKLQENLLKGEIGRMRAIDPATGMPSMFFYAPIASPRWMFVLVRQE